MATKLEIELDDGERRVMKLIKQAHQEGRDEGKSRHFDFCFEIIRARNEVASCL